MLELIEAILPRGAKQLIALAFLLGLLIFPRPFDSLFWSLVRHEEQQVVSLLKHGVGQGLHLRNHRCMARGDSKCPPVGGQVAR
jgi:hypothetical protein